MVPLVATIIPPSTVQIHPRDERFQSPLTRDSWNCSARRRWQIEA